MSTMCACRLGEPVTLCWQLDRRRPDAASQEVNTLQYDVHAAVRHLNLLDFRFVNHVHLLALCLAFECAKVL